jgi:restriction system protein
VARQRREVKKQLLDALREMKPEEFEQLVGRLLGAMGYEDIEVTRRSSDGGVDVLAGIEVGVLRLRAAVQVKRLKGNVQRPVVSQLRGDMALWDVDQGMIITTGGFSGGAKQVARLRNVTPITLIDGDQLTDLLIEQEIGVRKDVVEVVTFVSERIREEEE